MSTAYTPDTCTAQQLQRHKQDAQLHSVFAGILATIEQAPLQLKRAEYVARLIKMDWAFDFAPYEQWAKGRDELAALRQMQAEVDPSGELWNKHAHPDFKKVVVS